MAQSDLRLQLEADRAAYLALLGTIDDARDVRALVAAVQGLLVWRESRPDGSLFRPMEGSALLEAQALAALAMPIVLTLRAKDAPATNRQLADDLGAELQQVSTATYLLQLLGLLNVTRAGRAKNLRLATEALAPGAAAAWRTIRI